MSAPAGRSPADGPIGVFDSGVGGLTVLHELLVALPHEDFLYLGDTARFPYGVRPGHVLERFALQIADTLLERGAKLLVVACNSATAAALPTLEEHLRRSAPGVAVVGVVEPGAALAARSSANRRIGLLATPTTVRSAAYEAVVSQRAPDARLVSVACPDLAPAIQGDLLFDQRIVDTVRGYCQPLRSAEVDTVILGCTHFPLVAPLLRRSLGRGVQLVSSGVAVADQVERELRARDLESPREREGRYRFLCTGDVRAFRATGTRFLQMPMGEIEQLALSGELAA